MFPIRKPEQQVRTPAQMWADQVSQQFETAQEDGQSFMVLDPGLALAMPGENMLDALSERGLRIYNTGKQKGSMGLDTYLIEPLEEIDKSTESAPELESHIDIWDDRGNRFLLGFMGALTVDSLLVNNVDLPKPTDTAIALLCGAAIYKAIKPIQNFVERRKQISE